MQRFKNKIVVVTGAGSGIGRSTALRLDAEGAKLLIVDINEDQLKSTQSMLKNKESSSHVVDISSQERTCLLYTSDAARRRLRCRSRWSPYH